MLVVYVPFLQTAFHTVPLSLADWLVATGISASLLVAMEIAKVFLRRRDRLRGLTAPGMRAVQAVSHSRT
jgi:hypothetical protein